MASFIIKKGFCMLVVNYEDLSDTKVYARAENDDDDDDDDGKGVAPAA